MRQAHKANTKNSEDESCIGNFFKYFDFYKHLPDSLSEPSLTGGSISIGLIGVICLLLFTHTYTFLNFQKSSEIMVDVNSGAEKLHINMDITLPKCPCGPLSLDIVDVTGVHVVDIEGKLQKIHLDKHGNEIHAVEHIDEDGHAQTTKEEQTEEHRASLTGQAKSDALFKESMDSIAAQEGCKLSGFVFINKVPGNFHISGHHYPDVVQRLYQQGHKMDFTHKINHLSFGELQDVKYIEANYNEKFKHELDGRDTQQSKFIQQGGNMFGGPDALAVNYFLEISQIDYVDKTSSNQDENGNLQVYEAFRFRSSQTIKLEQGMPAIFFRYELSPIRIQYTMYMQSVTDYLVNICAVIGGIYAVSSVLDSVLRNSVGILGFGSVDDLPGHGTTQNATKRQELKRVKRIPDEPAVNNNQVEAEGLFANSGDQIEMTSGQ